MLNFRFTVALCFVLFSGCASLCAQTAYVDSLENVLASFPDNKLAHPDTNRIKLLNQLSLAYKGTGEYEKSHACANKVIAAYADSTLHTRRDSFFIGDAYSNKGITYFRQGETDSALLMHNRALKIFLASRDPMGYAMTYGHLSSVYTQLGDYPKALEHVFKALDIREQARDAKAVASLTGNIGEIYRYMQDTARAMHYHRLSLHVCDSLLKIHPKEPDLLRFKGNALNNIGILYDNRGAYEQAIGYHKLALQIRISVGDRGSIAASMNNLAMDFKDLGQYDTAMAYLQRAFSIKQKIGDKKGMAIAYLNMADVFKAQKNFDRAKSSLDSAQKYCSMVRNVPLMLEIYRTYSDYYKETNQPALALEWFERYIHVRDSVASEENQRAALRAEMNFTYARKAAADSVRLAAEQQLGQLAHEEAIHRQKLYTFGGIIGFVLAVIVAVISFRAYRHKQAANLIISEQKTIVEEKQKEILDSINYAKKIQYTLLAHETVMNENLGEHFVLFIPKDIVSGDFYWATQTADSFYLAVCDSTGHGVPGAFMSLLNISFLNEAINEKSIAEPHEILNYVRDRLINSVSKEGAQDGMDGTLIRIESRTGKISYSSAYNSPLLIEQGTVQTLKADKMPIGKGAKENSFSLHEVIAAPGSMLYLYTDGFADQFGGPKGKKFKYAQLNKVLNELSILPIAEQRSRLERTFLAWKGNLEQVDDVCLIGIRIK